MIHAVEKNKAERGDGVCGLWHAGFSGVFREGHTEKVTLKQSLYGGEEGHVAPQGKNMAGRGRSQCKGPEV